MHDATPILCWISRGRRRWLRRYAGCMVPALRIITVVASLALVACDDTPSSPTPSATQTVRIVFLGSTARRSDLPDSAQGCVTGVGATHIHPSWRSFAGIPLTPVPPDRYEMTFHRRAARHPRLVQDQRPELVRREPNRRRDAERLRQRRSTGPEHDDAGEWRRAWLRADGCAERDGDSIDELRDRITRDGRSPSDHQLKPVARSELLWVVAIVRTGKAR